VIMKGRVNEKRKDAKESPTSPPFPFDSSLLALAESAPSDLVLGVVDVEVAVVAAVAAAVAIAAPAPEQSETLQVPALTHVRTPGRSSPPNPHTALSTPFVPSPNSPDPKKCKHPARLQAPSAMAPYPSLLLSTAAVPCGIANCGSICSD
jgi:hypothetical protein